MITWGRSLRYGLLVWLVPFLVAFAAFPLKEHWRSLFESIMPVTLTLVVVFSTVRCLPQTGGLSWKQGLWLGFVWWVVSVMIDLPLMLNPPVSYTVVEYVADVGLTYMMIPVITVGMALSSQRSELSILPKPAA